MNNVRYQALGPLLSGEGSRAFLGLQITEENRAKPVVLVWVPETEIADAEATARLAKETARAAALQHPNIIRVYGLAQVDEGLARVVEYVDGETVRRVLDVAGTLPHKFAAFVAAEAAMGVHFAHLTGVGDGTPLVHGDIRPDTVLLSFAGVCKVSGYGALSVAPKEMGGKRVKGRRTYSAPEQVLGGRDASIRETDVYLLGILLYECLTGMVPFGEEKNFDEAVVNQPLRLLNLEAIPSKLGEVLAKATAKRATDRYSTALAFREALEHALGGLPSAHDFAAYLKGFFPEADKARAARRREIETGIAELARRLDVDISAVLPPPPVIPHEPVVDERPVAVLPAESREGALPYAVPESSAAPPGADPPTDRNPILPDPGEGLTEIAPAPVPARIAEPDPFDDGPTHPHLPNPIPARAAASVPPPRRSSDPRAEDLPTRRAPVDPRLLADLGDSDDGEDELEPDLARSHNRKVWLAALVGASLAFGVAGILWGVLRSPSAPPAPSGGGPQVPPATLATNQPPSPAAETKPPVDQRREDKPTDDEEEANEVSASATETRARPAPKPPAPIKSEPPSLELVVTPPLNVAIDGKPMGKSPLNVPLASGKHELVLSDATKGIRLNRTVQMGPRGKVRQTIEVGRGSVALHAPEGAAIFVDGKNVGTSPMQEFPVYEGSHKISVTLGKAKWQQSFTIRDTETMTFDVYTIDPNAAAQPD